MTNFGEDDGNRDRYLFACETCSRYYVLFVDSTKQECPYDHGFMKVVNGKSDHYERSTCLNDKCEDLLGMNLVIKGTKHERCGKNSAKTLDTLVNEYGSVTDDELEKHTHVEAAQVQGVRAARSLEAEVKAAEEFKTSHHKDKGGHHTASESARHEHGDKQDANIKRKKKETLKLFVENLKAAVPDWVNSNEHSRLIERAEAMINRL